MPRHRSRYRTGPATRALAASVAALWAGLACAGLILKDRDFSDSDWKFPEPPKVESMLDIPSPTNYRLKIDPDSIEVTDEGVTRYVLGLFGERTQHIYYEAMRCKSRGWRIYGVLQSDGTFRRYQKVDWQKITPMGPLAYRMPAVWMLFCSPEGVPYSAEEARQRVEHPDVAIDNYDK